VAPGADVDLRTEPSNNPVFGKPGQDQLYNQKQHGMLDSPLGDGTRFGTLPGAPAAAADVAEGDPNGIGDTLLESTSPQGGALTIQGVQQLQRFLEADKTIAGRAQSAMEQTLLRQAHAELAGPDDAASPEGDARFQNFLGAYFPALEAGLESGKTAAELLTPASPDYLGTLIPAFAPRPAPPAADQRDLRANDGIEVTPLPSPPPSPRDDIPGTNIPDPGVPEGINLPGSG
jgi:hypothetical protein